MLYHTRVRTPHSPQSVRIYVSTIEGGDVTSLSVRPWLDDIRILQTQVFSIDTPSQRQQLFLGDKQLEDDGRVLAQHGVVADSTIQLVSVVELRVIHSVGAVKRTDECVALRIRARYESSFSSFIVLWFVCVGFANESYAIV